MKKGCIFLWLYIKKKTVGLLARVEMFLINFEVNSNIFIFNYCCSNRVRQLVILLFPFLHERSLSEEYYQHLCFTGWWNFLVVWQINFSWTTWNSWKVSDALCWDVWCILWLVTSWHGIRDFLPLVSVSTVTSRH